MADTHTPASIYRALCGRLEAAGLKPGAHGKATSNPAPLADSSFTVRSRSGGDTGDLRTRSGGHMACRMDFVVEVMHTAPPKAGPQSHEEKRLVEWANVVRHLHVESTDLTREARVQFGDATFDEPGGGAYLRTTLPVVVQFTFSMALP